MELSTSLRKKNLAKEKLVTAKIKQDPKSFYSYAMSFQQTTQSVGPFLRGNALCKDKKFMAGMLLQQYSAVFSTPDPNRQIPSPHTFVKSPRTKMGLSQIRNILTITVL